VIASDTSVVSRPHVAGRNFFSSMPRPEPRKIRGRPLPPWPGTVPKSSPKSCPHRLASYQLPHTRPHNTKAGQLLESPGLLPFSLGLSSLSAATPIFRPFALKGRLDQRVMDRDGLTLRTTFPLSHAGNTSIPV